MTPKHFTVKVVDDTLKLYGTVLQVFIVSAARGIQDVLRHSRYDRVRFRSGKDGCSDKQKIVTLIQKVVFFSSIYINV